MNRSGPVHAKNVTQALMAALCPPVLPLAVCEERDRLCVQKP